MRKAVFSSAFLLTLAALVASPALAAGGVPTEVPADVTFHGHVESILQRSCQGCHRPEGVVLGGMRAPMSLVTYGETRPWARSIARQVESKEMPPWFASEHTKGQFRDERTLSPVEIATLVKWAKTGAAKGDPATAPKPIAWDLESQWSIGEPDLVLSLAEPFWVEDDVVDLNITLKAQFITGDMLPEARWIKAIEFKGGSSMVHHIVASKTAAESEVPGASGMLAGLAPGTEPFVLPEGVGRLLVPNTQIYLNMHYNKESGEGTGGFDNSLIAFKFHEPDAEITEVASWNAIGNSDFEIPPLAEKWFVGASSTFQQDITLYGFLPHMHLRGRAAKYTAHYPDGTSELLLDVPEYDWNWQTNYTYIEPRKMPAGTRIELAMWFENTDARNEVTALEINPRRAVTFGGPTTDEMMLGFMDYSVAIDEYEQFTELEGESAEVQTAAGGGR